MRVRMVLILLFVALMTNASLAQTPASAPSVQYAAKYVCGLASGAQLSNWITAPGRYFTAINVHNPWDDSWVKYRKMFVVALPNEKVGKKSLPIHGTLNPGHDAMQIDCGNIYSHLQITPGQFIEGYAVIQAAAELDVVAVYTTTPQTPFVNTLQTERVPARKIVAAAPFAN